MENKRRTGRGKFENAEEFNVDSWEPKTKLGISVKKGEIANIDHILDSGKKILESEIVDALVQNLKLDIISLDTTQRVTDSGRRGTFRAIVLVGDMNGHVGIGVGKSTEAKKAIESGTKDAKRKIIKVIRGCGSWECQCGATHSIPEKVTGKQSSTSIEVKPAPKGLGLAANMTVKKVLAFAGIKDAWSKARGSTGNKYNMLIATMEALKSLNKMNKNN